MSPPPYQPFLLNRFTMERIHLPVWNVGAGVAICKIILSSAPDSANCTVAAVAGSEFFTELRLGSVAVCRLRQKESSRPWWCITHTLYLEDIAFFKGKLNAVGAAGQTYEFEDGELEKMRNVHLFHGFDRSAVSAAHERYYLVACNERLLIVCRRFGINRFPGGAYHTIGFKVTEVSEHSYRRTRTLPPPPVEVKCFDGHALFIGDACCRAFASKDEGNKIKEDQICYADDESNTSVVLGSGSGTSSGAFQMVTLEGMPLRLLQSYDLRT
jgi:hypothetical protein